MKCPLCGGTIEISDSNDCSTDFLQIEVTCQSCGTKFFARIETKDLSLFE